MRTFDQNLPGSFRDPSAFVLRRGSRILRYLSPEYKEHYNQLMKSGLYDCLTGTDLLIRHTELQDDDPYTVIAPELVPFISYPYEWCFSQLKDAALTTLNIQKLALAYGMVLKDASAYNIQFLRGKPLLIDTSSFEKYEEGRPWVAYSQFCKHFLAPLALMCYKDIRLGLLMRNFLDGIPLDLAASLLPLSARLNIGLAYHLLLHAKVESDAAHILETRHDFKTRMQNGDSEKDRACFSKRTFMMQTEHLIDLVEDLELQNRSGSWTSYYDEHNYSRSAFDSKKELVSEFLDKVAPGLLFDLGANTGVFSNIAAQKNTAVVSLDADAMCVEQFYRQCKNNGNGRVLPLVSDLTNPSPSIGFALHERQSLLERGPADTALALALIHHLSIGNNVPLELCAGFMVSLCKSLIIEFVPKEDPQVGRLLAVRADVFPDYNEVHFERAFGRFFLIEAKEQVGDSGRTLFLMRKR